MSLSEQSVEPAREITRREGVLLGPVIAARNWSADAQGSIHDDATAGKLGFRGGTVAGNIHMDQFVPVLLEAFGEAWLEGGSLSLHFVNATTDRELVRAFVREPAGASQVDVWMEREDGMEVARGTASLGDVSRSALRTRELRAVDPASLRILRGLHPGLRLGPKEVRLDSKRQLERLERGLLSDPLPCHAGRSAYPGVVATPSATVELLWASPTEALRPRVGKAVGLFGAIEVAYLAGPLLLDRSYRVSAEVIALSESPKTEVLWFDSEATREDGTRAATLRMMLRFMKASSPLYAT
jgi:hypothetical protein